MGYAIAFAKAELAYTVKDVIVSASDASQPYWLPTISPSWFDIVQERCVSERDRGTRV